jgi:thiol-disulfide isomerase/thioredoxin
MKNIIYIFLIFLFISCGNNQHKPIEERQKSIVKSIPKVVKKTPSKDFNFLLKSIDNRVINIKTNSNYYYFSHVKKPIVLLNLFSTWCPPCIGQLPHLNNIQKKYKEKLSILGILLYDNRLGDNDLKKFIELHKINFFISKNMENNKKFANFIAPKLQLEQEFSIPLMVLFVRGRYYTHYEGSTPEEMIESDIKQALNQIKGR